MKTKSPIPLVVIITVLSKGCLLKDRVLHYSPKKAGQIVNACVILYNICHEYNIPDDNDQEEENIHDGIFQLSVLYEVALQENNHVEPELIQGRMVRDVLFTTRLANRR